MLAFNPLVGPLLVMLALTMAVFIAMTVTRVQGMKDVKDATELDDRLKIAPLIKGPARRCSDNFNNLLEVPVVFYVLTLLLITYGISSAFYVATAWIYVLLRVAHSAVHCTYNDVMHRFALHGTSCVILLVMLIGAIFAG